MLSGDRSASCALLAALLFAAPAMAVDGDLRLDLPRIGEQDEVELEAELLAYDRDADRAEAAGDVRLSVRDYQLFASRLILDLRAGFAAAEGEVLIDQGPRRLTAERLWLEIDGERAEAEELSLVVMDPQDRLLAQLSAGRLERVNRDLLLAERLCFTACDCPGEAPPSWSFTARRARLRPERGLWLFGAAFRVRDLPIVPLPVFYVPLGERRSGLLSPQLGYSGINGLRLAQPFYLVLGRSWDATLTAGYYGGVDTWSDESPSRPGLKGPDQSLELRWAPALRSSGALLFTHIFDQSRELADPQAPPRGSRWRLQLRHDSNFDGGGFGSAGSGLHLSLSLLSDAALVADLRPSIEQANKGYVRSQARAHAAPWGRLSLEGGARWLQDLSQRFLGAPGVDQRAAPLFGPEAPDTAQLLPVMVGSAPTLPVTGSLAAGGELRLALWQRPFGGSDRASPLLHARAGTEISHPIRLGQILGGRALAGVAADLWSTGDEPLTRAYPRFDLSLHTGLQRAFGSFSHRLRPGLQWRLVPLVAGGAPEGYIDVFERAVPQGGLNQARALLVNEIWTGGGRALFTDLSQGWDLQEGAPSDLEFELGLEPGSGRSLDALLGWDWGRSRLSFASARGRLTGESGAALNARWIWAQPEGSAGLLAGLDELFASGAMPPPPLAETGESIHEVVLGLSAPRFRNLSLRYDLSMDVSPSPRAPHHRAVVGYRSRCDCWSGTLTALWPPGRSIPELTVGVQLAGLGSVSSRR